MGSLHTACPRVIWPAILIVLTSSASVIAASGSAELDLPRATLSLGGGAPAKAGGASEEALVASARKAIRTHAEQLGVTSEENLIPAMVHAGKYGPGIVTFRQSAEGLDVFGARLNAALDGAANVRAITGGFSPHLKTLDDTGFKLDAQAAVRALLRNSGISQGGDVLKPLKARNAILLAMRVADAADYGLCRRGFATRGFGVGASAPDRFSAGNTGVSESFSTSDAALNFVEWRLEETSGGDGDGVLDVAEDGRLTVTLKNTGLVLLDQVRIHVPPLTWAYTFPSGDAASGIVLQPGEERITSFDVRLVTPEGARMLLFNLTASDLGHTDVYGQQDALFTVNYDLQRDNTTDWLISQQAFDADWTTGSGPLHGCALQCFGDLTNWRRTSHLGEFAYYIGARHISLDAHLTTVPFTLHPEARFRLVLTHDYSFAPGAGEIEISTAGGAWESIGPYLISGSAYYSGVSGGWRTDTLDFGAAFAGRTVQLRWRAESSSSFSPQPVHWALSRISIEGVATPMFSSMYVDVD